MNERLMYHGRMISAPTIGLCYWDVEDAVPYIHSDDIIYVSTGGETPPLQTKKGRPNGLPFDLSELFLLFLDELEEVVNGHIRC